MVDLIQEFRDCGNDPEKWIHKFDVTAQTFTAGSITSVAGFYLSLRYGTPEMAVAYQRLAGIYGVIGCSFALVRKHLTGEIDLTQNKSLQTTT